MATKQKRKQTTNSWSALFPTDISTTTGSQIFIKQLSALLFSCITHIRGIFPEYAFDDKMIDERKVKILNGRYECKHAYLLTRWLKSAFQALDLQYMKTLSLEILTVNDQPLEFYALDYKYSEDGPSCIFYANQDKNNAIHFSNADVENATKKLIFALLDATEGLGELPHNYQLQLRIHYYDERTPACYAPDYFKDAEPCDWNKVHNLKRIKLGTVTTNHHSVSLSSGSTLVPSDGSDQPFFNYSLDETREQYWDGYYQPYDYNLTKLSQPCNENDIIEISSESFNQFNHESEVEVKYKDCIKIDDSEEDDFKPPTSVESPLFQESVMLSSSLDLCSTLSVDSNDENKYRGLSQGQTSQSLANSLTNNMGNVQLKCICSLSERKDLFKCPKCEFDHHKICYKRWPDASLIDNTYCYNCSKENNYSCLDSHVEKCTEKQAKNLMLFRQLLYKIQYLKKISCTKVANDYNLTEFEAKKFIKKLSNEGFIKPTLNKSNYLINSMKLKEYIDQYFHY
ncbi:hypothetical protein O3M35_000709 [Rhynocoris fuscipes]|uniref:HORMA domain-containing protein n=1 Tax=Rhynocoris fuscipes TaxID=488301 RepID=A0AAW1DMP9_9HEMI